MIGYKVMHVSDDYKYIISGANNRLRFAMEVKSISMPGNGIYIGTDKEYVLDYYSGLHDNEVLLTVEFDENTIITGNINDSEPEISVSYVRIIDKEILN